MSSTRQTSPTARQRGGDDFKNRKFKVQKKGNDNRRPSSGVAVIRYGPKAVGAAQLLKAYFLNEAEAEYDPKRTDDVVDVVIGDSFQQLATTTEVNQSLVELGQPGAAAGHLRGAEGQGRRLLTRGGASRAARGVQLDQQVVQRSEERRRGRDDHVRPRRRPPAARSPAGPPPWRPGRRPRGPRR